MCVRVTYNLYLTDSVFSFMDTFEERSVEMKTNLSDTDQELADTSSKINEVSSCLHEFCYALSAIISCKNG